MQAVVRRRALVAGLCTLAGLPWLARAADPKPPPPDGDLLEYLGSGDDAESELQQYLAQPDLAENQDAKPAPKRGSAKT